MVIVPNFCPRLSLSNGENSAPHYPLNFLNFIFNSNSMNKKWSGLIVAITVILFIVVIIEKTPKNKTVNELTNIRIGWQTAWVPQAQLAEVLKHTDVLEKNGLIGDFKGFNYGGPLVEAAAAGQVDVLFVADFPAINLLSKTDKFSIVSRLDDFRNSIIVPASSTIQSISDLKGKTISVPFGSAPQVQAMKFIRESGYDPKDFNFKNLDILEQSNVIQKGTLEKWDGVDAFATWDPTSAIFENNGKAKLLKLFTPVGVVLMSNNFITQHPVAAKNFLKAFTEGYYYYAKNQTQANQWFIDETKFTQPQSVMDKMTSLEKNLLAQNIKDIDIKLYDAHIKSLQATADEAETDKLITKAPNMSQKINSELLDAAQKEILESNFDINSVKIK